MEHRKALDADAVRAVVEEARAFLEPRWTLFREGQRGDGVYVPEPSSPSDGMCRLSARFMLNMLDEVFPDEEWEVVGGAATPGEDTGGCWGGCPAGMQDVAGRWHGHYWIESQDGLVVDIAADQFGWEPVIVSDEDDVLSRYRDNYAEWALAEHMRRVRWTPSEWLGEWRTRHEVAIGPSPMP